MPRIRLHFGEWVISAAAVREKRMTPEHMAKLEAAIGNVTQEMLDQVNRAMAKIDIELAGAVDLSSPQDLRTVAKKIHDELRDVEREQPDDDDQPDDGVLA